jgi:KDO2-lipid IV(A) lauroyltransferase
VALVVRRLPRPWVLWLGRRLGRLWGRLDRRHLAIAAENLRRAFPDWDEARVERTARGVYAHFGSVILDLLWMEGRSARELLALADLDGLEVMQAAVAEGRGVLSPSAHYGNWEVQAVASSPLIGRIGSIARPLDNPALDRRLVGFRTSTGNEVFYKKNALGRVMRALRAGHTVAVLIDQNVQERDGIFVRYFGRPAATTTVAAAVALKTGCAIVPVRCTLQPNGRYLMQYGPRVEWKGSGRKDDDVPALTQHLTSIVEAWVREHPEQWLWLHRRWKTQPAAAPVAPPPGLESPSPAAAGDERP